MTKPQSLDLGVRQALLLDLFSNSDPLQYGEDKRRFRVRHHETIEVIDALVGCGDIRENQERYSPSLLALSSVLDQNVREFLKDCDAVYAALRARYLENYSDLILVDDLAAQAGIESSRFRRVLAFLNENISVIAGSQGRYGDVGYKLTPSEKVLTVRTFNEALVELRDFQAAFGGRGYLSMPLLEQVAPPLPVVDQAANIPHWISDLPDALCALMREVYTAQHEGLRALTVMGVRAAIDMACNDLVGDNGGFDAKLRELGRLGHVSELQCETLTAVIHMGHASAHRGHIPKTKMFTPSLISWSAF